MRVLLFAPPFYSLHKQIIGGLENLGMKVGFIPDQMYKFDSRGGNKVLRMFHIPLDIVNGKKRDKQYEMYSPILSEHWDYFLCINGFSFIPQYIETLKKSNPALKTVLYLWDSVNFYDFSSNFKYFDTVFSFDPEDSKKYNINYKPLFWTSDSKPIVHKPKQFDLSFVGTQHTIRYQVLKEVERLAFANNLKCKFHLQITKKKNTLIDHIKYMYYYFGVSDAAIGFKDEYLIRKGKIKDDFIKFHALSPQQVNEIIESSHCIIDIAKPKQRGLTNRAIESLGKGRKILTNVPVSSSSKYYSIAIKIIDPKEIVLNLDFIKKDIDPSIFGIYQDLHINKWIKSLLSDKNDND